MASVDMITFKGVKVSLEHFTLHIPYLEIDRPCVYVTGPNGSGKSTFLRLIAGLILPDEGSIDGIEKYHNKIGYVAQNYKTTLLPWLNAEENVALFKNKDVAIKNLINIGFNKTDLKKRPNQLSGGQCQRIAIARECIDLFSLVIMDEPFSGLDYQTIPLVGDLIANRIASGTTFLLTSHTKLPSEIGDSDIIRKIEIIRKTDVDAVLEVKQ